MKERLKRLGWTLFPHFFAKRYLSYEGTWAEIEEAIVPIFLSKTTECVDVGANNGSYTVLMSLFSRHVHAFEPNLKCVANLQNMCLRNASIYHCALSSAEGFSEYFVPVVEGSSISGLGTLDRSVLSAYRNVDAFTVPTSTLDSLCAKPISFVKIDVEGHEMDVLNGGRKLISEQKPVFMVEAEERHCAGTVQRTKEFFYEFDYQGLYILEEKVFPFVSFDYELQNCKELARPTTRKQMRYVNNFIFVPPSLNVESVIEKMSARLSDKTWRQNLI
jgi:FkbM family methyltransferase